MTTYTIEKNVPLPARQNARPARYPFADMEVGDSFLVPGKGSTKDQSHISAYAIMVAKRLGGGRKFATRQVGADLRVWRIA